MTRGALKGENFSNLSALEPIKIWTRSPLPRAKFSNSTGWTETLQVFVKSYKFSSFYFFTGEHILQQHIL